MKNKRFILTVSIAAALLAGIIFAACSDLSVSELNNSVKNIVSDNKDKTTVSLRLSAGSERTALPVINWEDFTYELTAVQNPGEANQKDSVTIFTNRTKENLVQGAQIDIGKYKFTLNAYKDSVKVLSGNVTQDISVNTALNFRMLGVTGTTGSCSVKISFPNDTTVATVKAAWSTEMFASVTPENLDIKTVMGKRVVTFAKENLPSATEQYAQFWFYDAVGTLIYSSIESLTVVGGCVSSSELELTSADWHTYACAVQLKKDGVGWISSGKTVKLVNQTDSSKQYVLNDMSGGSFEASVSEGDYFVYVNDENTNVGFKSVNKKAEVNYWTIQFGTELEPVRGCTMNVVSGGYDVTAKKALVLNGTNFVYSISLVRGYKTTAAGLVVKHNGAAVEDAAFDTNLTVSSVKESQIISVSGTDTITYSISYVDDNGAAISSTSSSTLAYWTSGYTAPASFTVEHAATLPGMANVKKQGNRFDVWHNSSGSIVKETEGFYEDLVLTAGWKNGVTVIASAECVYANGISLLICSEDGKTCIYEDYDGNGVAGVDDLKVENDGNDDFTGYAIYAANVDGKPINSDFTFTMTGGTVAEIHGLDDKDNKRTNKSTLNLSGNSVIGSATDVESVSEDGIMVKRASSVRGVDLASITNEWVNINASMTGNYKVYCVTPYSYEETQEHTIAYITNKNFASLKNFVCFTDTEDESEKPYKKADLTTKSIKENGIERIIIRLAGSGVSLPDATQVDGDVTIEFGLGDSCVNTDCSVFSIRATGGTFRVNDRLTITKNQTDEERGVEDTLTYMVQPTPSTYETSLAFDKTYVYMHILSTGNNLKPEMANDFLKQVYFKRDNSSKPMTIKVNLEVVPAKDIEAAEVKYFDGSFYKLIRNNPDTGAAFRESACDVTWIQAYNWAKKMKFNDLDGYLMTITSDVENNYIFNQYTAKLSWMGATRLMRQTGTDDDEAFDGLATNDYGNSTKSPCHVESYYRWACGPESGMKFFNAMRGPQSDTDSKTAGDVYYNGEKAYHHWNNQYLYSVSSGLSKEPNNSSNMEPCVQFLADGKTAGYWNDQKTTPSSSGYYSSGFFVEFSPYEYYWDGSDAGDKSQVPHDKPITRTATY